MLEQIAPPAPASVCVGRVVLVLGMHRSGTSCLVGGLEQCGINLGEVERGVSYVHPAGTHEHRPATVLHESILTSNGGSWSDPPPRISVSREQRAGIDAIARELMARSPSALKDPRLLLLIDVWLAALERARLVGTFRHPAAVARSLWRRNRFPEAESHVLWCRYNAKLVELHRAYGFPLIHYSLSDVGRYRLTVYSLAIHLGLTPVAERLDQFIDDSMDRGETASESVPKVCGEIYAYLQSHRWSPDLPDRDLVDWKAGPVRADSSRRAKLLSDVLLRAPRPLASRVWNLLRRGR